jgi:hypothetical protein
MIFFWSIRSFIYCLNRLFEYIEFKTLRVGFFIIFFTPLIIAWIPVMNRSPISDLYFNYKRDRAEEIADYLKDKKGMVNIEVASGGRALEYIISRKAGPLMRSDYNILVESSIQAPFMVAFRGSYSLKDERMSVDAYLRSNKLFRSQSDDNHAIRAQQLGVNYFLVSTRDMKDRLSADPHMTLEKDFGIWRLYHLVEPVQPIRVVTNEPTLVFAEATYKKRSTKTFDFARLQEELFFNAEKNIVIAHTNHKDIDTAPELSIFNQAIISDYQYHSYDKARTRLIEYAKNHPLVLVEANDPLYADLKVALADNSNVLFIPLPDSSTREGVQEPVRINMGRIFDFLNAHAQPVGAETQVKSLAMGDKEINVTLAQAVPKAVPILVSTTYFPAWKQTNGEPTYLSNTSYTLIYVKDNASIVFTTPWSVKLGSLISLLTLGGVVYIIIRNRKSKS